MESLPRVVVTDYRGDSYLLEDGLEESPDHWFYRDVPNLLYRNRFVEAMNDGKEKWSSLRATTFAVQPFRLFPE
jgi:hypothetical protein